MSLTKFYRARCDVCLRETVLEVGAVGQAREMLAALNWEVRPGMDRCERCVVHGRHRP